jgi:hypothetical protein
LDLDEVLLFGAPVAKMASVSAREKDTSRSTSPAAASPCHGCEHALGRGKTVAHALANADPSSAVHRHEQRPSLSPSSPFALSEISKLL